MSIVADKQLAKTKIAFMRYVRNTFCKYEKKESNCIHIPNVFERTKTAIKNNVLWRTPYEVYDDNGVEKLILKKRGPNGLVVEVLPFEELFHILYDLHVENDHKCLDLAPLLTNYKYPNACLSILKRSCLQCKPMPKGTKNEEETLNVGSVYIIPVNITLSANTDDPFHYVLIYVHKITNFIVLRPLTEKNPLEVSVELLKIITEYQPPQCLWIHGYDEKLYEDIRESFVKIWPFFGIGFKHVPAGYSIPSAVVTRLNVLYQAARNASWVILLPYIQKNMNIRATTHGVKNWSNIKGPHDELFTKNLLDNFGGVLAHSRRRVVQLTSENGTPTGEFTNNYDDLFETDDFIDNVIIPDLIKEETIGSERPEPGFTNPEWERNVEIISTVSLTENKMFKKE